jgi:quercetin dioxygenase-like cupin family protein
MKNTFTLMSTALGLTIVLGIAIAQSNDTGKRMSPAEIDSIKPNTAGPGTSGISGIQTRVLKGDPTKAGLYTIQLTVPANTKIEAHTHPDDRVATVVSGTWYIGYGSRHEEAKLKSLTPGSFYTEPPNVTHFARTGDKAVVLQITGYGPTGTTYVESPNK